MSGTCDAAVRELLARGQARLCLSGMMLFRSWQRPRRKKKLGRNDVLMTFTFGVFMSRWNLGAESRMCGFGRWCGFVNLQGQKRSGALAGLAT